jgi:hypothetical protein
VALVVGISPLRHVFIVSPCKRPLSFAMQMETVSQALVEVPYGVDDAVDWPNDVISHWRDSERELADPSELREQAFSV